MASKWTPLGWAVWEQLAPALESVLHVHAWSAAGSHAHRSWVLGPVRVHRQNCRCGIVRMAVEHAGHTSEYEVTHTDRRIAVAWRMYIGAGSGPARRALGRRAAQLGHSRTRYMAYEKGQEGSNTEHQRFDELLAIVVSMQPRSGRLEDDRIKRSLEIAGELARELDIVELALFGKSPALISSELFGQLLAQASERLDQAQTIEPDHGSLPQVGRWHWHRWGRLSISEVYSPQHKGDVIVEVKRCRCGHKREVISRDGALGRRVLQIRRLG